MKCDAGNLVYRIASHNMSIWKKTVVRGAFPLLIDVFYANWDDVVILLLPSFNVIKCINSFVFDSISNPIGLDIRQK